jgi:hypothetical protein
MGACACRWNVRSGTNVIDSCATKCISAHGSFVYFRSQADVEWKGISVFDCDSTYGALDYLSARATVSRSNLTDLDGRWGSSAWAAALVQYLYGSTTNASFVVIADCSEGEGCFANWCGDAAAFRHCSFVNNSVGAIMHRLASVQDVLMFCYFVSTNLSSSLFDSGSVLVDSCLFAGAVPTMPVSFTLTGVPIGYTSTRISFDTAWLLPTCGGIRGLPTQVVKKPPAGTGPHASSRLFVRMVVFFLFLALPL